MAWGTAPKRTIILTPTWHCTRKPGRSARAKLKSCVALSSGELNVHKKNRRKGNQVIPDKVMDGLEKELNSALKSMSKTKDINEKEIYSRIIKNLCESQGVFLKLASEIMPFDFDDDLEGDDIDGDVIPF
jgi:hypothetical protein